MVLNKMRTNDLYDMSLNSGEIQIHLLLHFHVAWELGYMDRLFAICGEQWISPSRAEDP